jgi:hypothetical protein
MRKALLLVTAVVALSTAAHAAPVQWYAATSDAGCQPQIDPSALQVSLFLKGHITSSQGQQFTPDGHTFLFAHVDESDGHKDYFFLSIDACMAFEDWASSHKG